MTNKKNSEPRFYSIDLGDLPCDVISAALGIDMPVGTVHFSVPAQQHAYKRHPDTFHLCEPYLAKAVASPTYIGQAPDHKDSGFEIVFQIPSDGSHMLLAVTLRPCNRGIYRIKSVYLIDNNKLSRRIRKGYLKKNSDING